MAARRMERRRAQARDVNPSILIGSSLERFPGWADQKWLQFCRHLLVGDVLLGFHMEGVFPSLVCLGTTLARRLRGDRKQFFPLLTIAAAGSLQSSHRCI